MPSNPNQNSQTDVPGMPDPIRSAVAGATDSVLDRITALAKSFRHRIAIKDTKVPKMDLRHKTKRGRSNI